MELVYLLIGIAVGFAIGFLFFKLKTKPETNEVDKHAYDTLLAEKNLLQVEKGRLEGTANSVNSELAETKQQLNIQREKVIQLTNDLATSNNAMQNLQQKLTEQKQEVEQLQERFKIEFENIANKLLEEKSEKFTKQNQDKIGEILKPLNEKIKSFEDKVEQTHKETLEKNAGLVQQILSLKDLNLQMSEEARNLTKALKGDNKAQGNWGEVILERVLEKSGLTKNREYFVQESVTTEDGKRLQPDVVIHLPDNKNVVVDSKVSLVDYERFVSANTEEEQLAALKKHIQSIRNHVKGLSEKNYHQLYGAGSPDFVLLFVPIEPAFILAVQHDSDLFNEAFERNIVIVSTSTLLATLRTIASIWRQENQNKNALEIARQAGDLYDKFHGFVEDLIKVGKQIDGSKQVYEEAMKKLYDGKGNLVTRAQRIKELGAKASKSLPQSLLDRAEED